MIKYRINQIQSGDDEIVINCKSVTPEIERLLSFLKTSGKKLLVKQEGQSFSLSVDDILYIEKVDENTFVYTEESVYRLDMTLYEAEEVLADIKFFRCSKSMIVNIDMVEKLKSLPSNRIDVVMKNGEHIIISRTYASEFRKILKGGAGYER